MTFECAKSQKRETFTASGDKSGITLSQIARIETGRINTTVSTVFVLIKAIGAEANELFE